MSDQGWDRGSLDRHNALTPPVPLESWAITPICRRNRGVDGAWQEAVDQLREVYDAQVKYFGADAVLTLSLTRVTP
jgi:hypothetical protein